MEERKLYKPKSCLDCCVCVKGKGRIMCGCWNELQALTTDKKQMQEMYNACKIDWD